MAEPSQMQEIAAKEGGWEELWQKKMTPWDHGEHSPALSELFEEKGWKISEGPVLVPGCGSGYDVEFFARVPSSNGGRSSRTSTGLDLSPLAAATANQRLEQLKLPEEDRSRMKVISGDFFATEDNSYDTVYDYTFFCALPPSMRPQWAQQMSKIIRPSGQLITLMFPIVPGRKEGPPYSVKPEDYEELLVPLGFDCVYKEVPNRQHDTRKGKEVLAVWKKK
ncbi:thiol methyltransferase 1 [Planoprotostelium fungivorum]|uniref:Thiol methyltransferase 1 n=1 Tax=Planoprotostelium fungivorum TaxID=1890364 RepID=A0A2P6NFC8_9EUKA|nr:thiol methyltransferase 1 [Planoprotostelium fungivorum]